MKAMEQDTGQTTVTILGRSYRLKIAEEDRKYLCEAAERIEQQARQYGKRYAYHDNQDLLAMVVLSKLTQFYKAQELLEGQERRMKEELSRIDGLLAAALEQPERKEEDQ